MNPVIKGQWIAALRSGDYTQGHGWLSADGDYCCLGVLCELAVHAGVIERLDNGENPDGAISYGVEGDVNRQVLPQKVRIWAELDEVDPIVSNPSPEYPDDTDSLANMNDGGYTFGEIADAIERDL